MLGSKKWGHALVKGGREKELNIIDTRPKKTPKRKEEEKRRSGKLPGVTLHLSGGIRREKAALMKKSKTKVYQEKSL